MSVHAVQAAERFDRWAKTYGEDRISSWLAHYQSLALAKLDLEEGPGFLDVGCGHGAAVRQAATRLQGGAACGIDISPQMVNRAKALTEDDRQIEFLLANSESIPYDDETFHSILCTCSFHHYEQPLAALAEIKRVLRPQGKFALLDSARDVYLPIWLQDRFRRYLEKSHVRYYTTSEMRDLITAAGFQILGEIQTFRRFMQLGKVFTGLMLVECKK